MTNKDLVKDIVKFQLAKRNVAFKSVVIEIAHYVHKIDYNDLTASLMRQVANELNVQYIADQGRARFIV